MEKRVANLWLAFAVIRPTILSAGIPKHRHPEYEAFTKRALTLDPTRITDAEHWIKSYTELVLERQKYYDELPESAWVVLKLSNTTIYAQQLNRYDKQIRIGWNNKRNIFRRTFIRGPKTKRSKTSSEG